MNAGFGSKYRIRLISLVEQGRISPDDTRFDPPLTDSELRFIGLAPPHQPAEALAAAMGLRR